MIDYGLDLFLKQQKEKEIRMKIHFKAKTEFQQQQNTTAISSVNAFSCTCCGGETWSIAAVFFAIFTIRVMR